MANTDFYEILGVSKNATDTEIKSAYRKQAMKYHPDRNQGDKAAEEKFKEVNKAYEVLKDPQKKAAYDQYGAAAFENGMGGSQGFGSQGFGGQGFDGFDFSSAGGFSEMFSDIFSDFMGGGSHGRERDTRGQDLRYDIVISLEEAFNGLTKTISFKKNGKCQKCNGMGGDSKVVCSKCHGSGVVNLRQGIFFTQQTCPDCQGTGYRVKNPCHYCSGTGISIETKTLDVKIPAGVDNGTKLRIRGEGEAGLMGGSSGDLFVYIVVKPHKIFTRNEKNLFIEVPISFGEAGLGGTIEVPIIEGGKAEVNIPKGIQSGERLRLRGKGMTGINSGIRGDMYLNIKVETPTKLTNRQEQLLREFEEERIKHGDKKSFFDKIKDWL